MIKYIVYADWCHRLSALCILKFKEIYQTIVMSDLHFCPQCGAVVQESALFCTACGVALSTIKNVTPENKPVENNSPETITPVQHKTAETFTPKKTVPLFSRQVHILIIVLIFAGIGVWIWYLERNKNSSDTEAVLTGKQ